MRLPRLGFTLLVAIILFVGLMAATRTLVFAPSANQSNGGLPIAGDLTNDVIANATVTPPGIAATDLEIPSLGITAPIKYAETNDEDLIQSLLVEGIVHYPGTAYPGELGNAYIVGHSSDYLSRPGNYKRVFAELPKIEQGAAILVRDAQGVERTFAVIETKIVEPTDLSVLDQGNYERRLISLQASYPVGTARQRFITIAELVEPEAQE